MKTFKELLSEVAQPKTGDEMNFKAKHEIELQDYPTDEESIENIFKGGMNGKDMSRGADYLGGEDEIVYESTNDIGKLKVGDRIVYDGKLHTVKERPKHLSGDTWEVKAKKEGEKNVTMRLTPDNFEIDESLRESKKIIKDLGLNTKAVLDRDGSLSIHYKDKNIGNQDIILTPRQVKELHDMIMNEDFHLEDDQGTKQKYVKKASKTKTDDGDGLDPVGKGDADIDNDGDTDSTDEYLHARRKAIAKTMKKDKNESKKHTFKSMLEKYAKPSKKTDDGEGMDPVGHGDADIDNDGDTDASDEYLRNRRKTIAKAMKKEETHLDEAQSSWRVEIPGIGVATVKGANEDQALKRALSKLKISKAFQSDWVSGKKRKKIKIVKESVELNEAFKAGKMKLDDGSSVTVSKQDATLLNNMFADLNAKNKKEMKKVVMTDKTGFEEIVGFAREAM